jgi:beta-xylosidase
VQNPVLWGDFADPDVIRVGDAYWLITSTFEYSPGMAVLRSFDLITWEFVTHCVADMTAIGPEYASGGTLRDGRGIFAGAIRFHNDLFYVYFATLDEGIFVTTASDPAGPWGPPTQLWDAMFWDDPCPIWGSDGVAWLIASRPGEPADAEWMTYVMPMAADGLSVDPARLTVLDPTWSSEGNKAYEIDGRFYVLHNESRSFGNRVAVIMRSDSMLGPWEKRDLIVGSGIERDREPNQGALVDTPDGSWYFVTHHGRMGYAEGRSVSVLPVTWTDGWPVAGVKDGDGVGRMAWDLSVPIAGGAAVEMQLSDNFVGRIGPQWEWRYEPEVEAWSVLPGGGLRIESRLLQVPGDPRSARNTLTQRQVGGEGDAQVHFDVGSLLNGDVCGLAHYGGQYSSIQFERASNVSYVLIVRQTNDGDVQTEHRIVVANATVVSLRTHLDNRGYVTFGYALDDQAFTPFGDVYRPGFARYRGNRLALQVFGNGPRTGHAIVRGFEYLQGTQSSANRA